MQRLERQLNYPETLRCASTPSNLQVANPATPSSTLSVHPHCSVTTRSPYRSPLDKPLSMLSWGAALLKGIAAPKYCLLLAGELCDSKITANMKREDVNQDAGGWNGTVNLAQLWQPRRMPASP